MKRLALILKHKLTFLLFIILGWGLVMLSSATSVLGYNKFNDSYWFVKHQLIYGFLPGLIIFLMLSKVDYRYWKKYATFFYILSLGLLLLVFVPGVGSSLGTGSRSWVRVAGYSFQPAEIVKLLMLVFVAVWLEKRKNKIADFKTVFLPLLLMVAVPSVLLILQPDVGTLMIFLVIIFLIYFAAGASWKHLATVALLGLLGLGALIKVAPYRLQRLAAFLNPELDPQGIGYHINQALLAIGSGGWFGLGLGHSRQKFLYLPEVAGDSIFAIMAEELGFVAMLILIILFIWLFISILKVGRRAPDMFGYLLCVGVAVWILGQFFVNMGAMLGVFPLTGLPMPLISYGGTALMINMAAVGLVLSVAKYSNVGGNLSGLNLKKWKK